MLDQRAFILRAMRKELFRMDRAHAVALFERSRVVHIASTTQEGAPVIRVVHAVVVRGALAFHGAPAGEKTETVGREAVVSAEEIVASIPSYFLDPERACPATTLYRSAQAHGPIELVEDPAEKAEVLAALMRKYQPEGGYAPLDAASPLYKKALSGIMVLRVPLERLDGKEKLAQNRSPEERARLMEQLWARGEPTDPAAIERIRAANPGTPLPAFLGGPRGTTLATALFEKDADAAAALVVDAYWNGGFSREELARAHLGSTAWVGARDETGALCATARALSDGSKRAWVYDVMVAPEHRGAGLGDALVRLLLDHPVVRGARTVFLRTRDAHGFYARLGFEDLQKVDERTPETASSVMVLTRS